MDLLAELENYLEYMGQVGFTGLALETNPFEVKAQAKRPPAMPAKQFTRPPAGGPPPPPPPKEAKPKQERKKADISNLFNIMDMVAASSTTEDTSSKAAQVSGPNQMETLKNLYQAFRNCQACALGTTREQFVFAEGPPNADLMFVGDMPGPEEDRTGMPFRGEAGALLTKIITAMGVQRREVFLTTVVKCHPPGGRAPLTDEIDTCSPVLAKQIDTVQPRVIVALGPAALRFFKGPNLSLNRCRGRFFDYRGIPVMPTYDPDHILRNPASKREVWADIQLVMARLKG